VSSIYLDAYQATTEPLYSRTAADIFDYVIADLQSPEGGFYSSRDADSEGLEGAYYIWTVDQVREVLGEEDARLFCSYFDVTESGNWVERFGHAPPGPKNILHVLKPRDVFARLHELPVDDLDAKLREWRTKMLAARAKRAAPGLDDKVLTEWNGLMIASLAKGAAVLDEPRYAEAASRAAQFVLRELRKDGRLLRTWRSGQARLAAYLNDYAAFIEALLNLYEATYDRRWLDEAASLMETAIKYYHDDQGGGFFVTAHDGEQLIARSKNPQDGAIPSGNSIQAMNLLRLSILLGRDDYRQKAEGIFRAFGETAGRSPSQFERFWCSADFFHDRVKEIVIVGDPKASETKALLRTIYDRYIPNRVLLVVAEATPNEDLPLLKGRSRVQGRSTAFVCEKSICKLPVHEPGELVKLLEAN